MAGPILDAGKRLAERSVRRGTCLLYTAGCPNHSGHRRMSFYGRMTGVHRIAYTLAKGPVPEGLIVRHTCDVPNCVEPEHLLVGTHLDNADDRGRRGRTAHPTGSKNGYARLTEGQVEQILIDLSRRELSQRAIGLRYGVSQPTIARISAGITWTHVTRPERNAAA